MGTFLLDNLLAMAYGLLSETIQPAVNSVELLQITDYISLPKGVSAGFVQDNLVQKALTA